MRLKSISIKGFKSFADKVNIDCDRGVTCIVGPNGSGKSNITEAVRWVLGEQSPKQLRGSKMSDVIFNGSDKRSAMSMAEVRLSFDNADGYLDIPFEEVEISRRYYKSGEGEYMINRNTCRLKDIQALFADTGIGKDGYSMISQGRVDEVLNANGRDRRKIFDEACGLVKYKLRKEESEKKLLRVYDNLSRISDLSAELEKNIGPMSEEAEKAEVYLDLSAKLKFYNIAALLSACRESEDKLKENDIKIADIKKQINDLSAEREDLRLKLEEAEAVLLKAEEDLRELRSAENRNIMLSADYREEIAAIKERIKAAAADHSRLIAEKEELQAAIVNFDRESADAERQIENLAKHESKYADEIEQLEGELKKAEAGFSEDEKAISAQREILDDLREEGFQLSSQIDILDEKIRLNEIELKKFEEKRQSYYSDNAKLKFRSEDLAEKLRGYNAEIVELKAEKLQAKKEAAEAEEDLAKLNEEAAEALSQIKNLTYKARTLEEMEENFSGYAYGVKAAMEYVAANHQLKARVPGPFGDLIETDERYAVAVEFALGGAINNIVVERRSDLSQIIDYLKRNRAGRAGFLPLDAILTGTVKADDLARFEQIDGFLGVLCDKVKIAPEYRAAALNLLGRVPLAEDLEAAEEMADVCGRRYKILTLDGEVINPGGSVTGGYAKKSSSGVLNRSKKIADLLNEADDYQKQYAVKNALKEDLLNKISDAEALLEQNDIDLLELQAAAAAADNEYKNISARIKENAAVKEADDLSFEAIGEALKELKKEAVERKEALKANEEKAAAITAEIDELDKLHKKGAAQREMMYKDLLDLKVSLTSISESRKALKERIFDLHEEHLRGDEKIENLQAEIKAAELAVPEAEKLRDEKQAALKAHEAEIAPLRQKMSLAEAEIAARKGEKLEIDEAINENFKRASGLDADIGRLETQKERFESESASYKNRIWDEYKLSFIEARNFCDDYDFKWPASKAAKHKSQADAIREEISLMGPVNPLAAEQYKASKERYDYLQSQSEDMHKSAEECEKSITELNETMTEVFRERFALIARNFEETFSELFEGGRAEITLNSDEILDSDIIIKAEPPGKKLRSLSLLSGGERALTAIALLFAIFKMKAAPFCILDEVDSALDDVNAEKFASYIKKYSNDLQFIVVTHRRITMSAADGIYGVGMKERGVSSLISVKA